MRVDSDVVRAWAERDVVRNHIEKLRTGEKLEAQRRQCDPEHLGPAYWAVHTLSHALMAELALECGYPLSSLKERIYASKPAEAPRHAILIYTATSGGQGTLGGLSQMAARVPALIDRAVDRLALCSNDPVCSEHKPDDPHDDRHLHGAACHACLLVPETSCEARNVASIASSFSRTVLPVSFREPTVYGAYARPAVAAERDRQVSFYADAVDACAGRRPRGWRSQQGPIQSPMLP